EGGASYAQAVGALLELVGDPSTTPSAKILEQLTNANCSFFDYALTVARSHRDYFASITPLSDDRNAEFEREVTRSLQQQREIEASDEISLDQYLENYFNSD
ncbi:MAG: glutamate--cysteine ligase, partial [Gammaproteobacteria bacterium]|nr:glutamate--cysteine ligase [Gammaproteobacteria bacterium]